MRKSNLVSISISIALVFVVFFVGVIAGANGVFAEQVQRLGLQAFAAVSSDQPEGVDFTPVWRAWNLLDQKYVNAYATSSEAVATTPEERVWGMIQGLAASLGDPYTVFLPPSEAEIFQADISGSFEGVGMEIAIRDNVLTVVSPLKGTPASRSGLKSADQIIEIDGESTRNLDIDAAVQRIRGPKGTEVVFTVLREGQGEALTITVVRDTIEIPTIETELRADGIFVIELLNFSAKSPELFRNALREFVDTGSRKLIVDLRGNPGGFLEASVDIASWFLPSGKIIVTEDFGGKAENRIHRSRGYDLFSTDTTQVVILVDRGSASASEILAGSLKEHQVATVIGTRTFGKGSVQELLKVTGETSLKVTVARWLLAGDVFITQDGIEPNITVEIPENAEDSERDVILEEAIEFLSQE